MSDPNRQKMHPLVTIGLVLMAVGIVLSMTTVEKNGAVQEFLYTAAPWVLLGLGVACTVAGNLAGNKKDQ